MEVDIPGYDIISDIAKGGMATVYIAIQKNFDRQVALKIMAPRLTTDPQFGVRFLREARIVASLNHRNIVPVFDVGHHGDFHYLAMEYLPGGDLKTRLRAGMSPENALYAVYEIANALAYAHSKSIIHRDIKPENVLFREDSTLVLTDFGIAKAMDSSDLSLTSTGVIVGSPHYMSPEQALAKPLDTRTDIYSLGVVLYEALVGRPLYDAGSSVAAAISHISNPIPKLPQRYACLQPILEKMVAKQPEDRFPTMAELELALEPFLRVPSDQWHTISVSGGEAPPPGVTQILHRPGLVSRSGQFSAPRRDTPAPHIAPDAPTQLAHNPGSATQIASSQTASTQGSLTQIASDQIEPTSIAAGAEPTQLVNGQTGNEPVRTQPHPIVASIWRRLASPGGIIAGVVALVALPLLGVVGTGEIAGPDPSSSPPDRAETRPSQEAPTPSVAATPNLADELAPEDARETPPAMPPPPALDKADAAESLELVSLPAVPVSVQAEVPEVPEVSESPEVPPVEQRVLTAEEQAQIAELLTQAADALERERLMYPKGSSAYDHYKDILDLQPGHTGALKGLEDIVSRYRALASQQLNAGNVRTAREYVARAESIAQTFDLAQPERANLAGLRDAVDRVFYLDTLSNLEKWNRALEDSSALTIDNLNEAYRYYMAAIEDDIEEPRVSEARKRYAEAFYELGKRYFKKKDMDVSHELIAKGLEINPRHEDLQSLDARWQRRRDGKESFFDRLW